MKKIFALNVFLFVCADSLLPANERNSCEKVAQDMRENYTNPLFGGNNKPRLQTIELLQLVGMESLSDRESSLIEINNWAQKNLLRQGERWEKQVAQFEELGPRIKPLLTDLGFVVSEPPRLKEYQGVLLHGGFLKRTRARLAYAVKQWEEGIRFKHIYFLTGERPLESERENIEVFLNDSESPLKIRSDLKLPAQFPSTEGEMTRLVWEQSEIPEEMRREVTVHFIIAPMKTDPKTGKRIRPTTDDTVYSWLEQSPPFGAYLGITNCPYTNRQDLVTRTIAPEEYTFETIGPEADENEKMAIFLDEVARFIFQSKQMAEKNIRKIS